MSGIKIPHDDVVVITIVMKNFKVHRIMIDNDSAANILFYNTFLRMKLPKDKHMPVQCSFYRFNEDAVMHVGIKSLLITLGTTPRLLNLMIEVFGDQSPFGV